MDLLSLLLGYFGKSASTSTTLSKAKESFLEALWNEVKPWLIKEDPDLATDLADKAGQPYVQARAKAAYEKLLQNPEFCTWQAAQLQQLQQKNVIENLDLEIEEGDVHIGDRNPSDQDAPLKNVLRDSAIKTKKGNFRLGDG